MAIYPESAFDQKVIPSIEKTRYPDEVQRSDIPLNVEFKFDGDRPISIEVGSRSFEVQSQTTEFSADSFFENKVTHEKDGTISGIYFSNPEACEYVKRLMSIYTGRRLGKIRQGFLTSLALESGQPPGDYEKSFQKLVDKAYAGAFTHNIRLGKEYEDEPRLMTIAKDVVDSKLSRQKTSTVKGEIPILGENWLSDAQQEVLDWIEEIGKTGSTVRISQTKIMTGKNPIEIFRVSIGDLDIPKNRQYAIEESVVQSLFYCADELDMPLRRNVKVFDTSVFEIDTNDYSESPATRFMGTKGKYDTRMTILINSSAMTRVDKVATDEGLTEISGTRLVKERQLKRIVTHEAAHAADIYAYDATTPQREGFATAVECGMNFSLIVRRNLRGYDNEITPERVELVFSSNPPEGLVSTEVYDISGAFYCWLYENLGRESVKNFYARISGANFQRNKRKMLKESSAWSKVPQDFKEKGNLYEALENLPHDYHWIWNNSHELVDNFIFDLNRKRQQSRR